jgi:hypothetical protein
MRNLKKERLYINDIVSNPTITYPAYYNLSNYQQHNEFLQDALISIHSSNLSNYKNPKSIDEVFEATKGSFAIYKEYYVVGFFGSKLMYLEPNGWKSMNVVEGIFDMKNWLIIK